MYVNKILLLQMTFRSFLRCPDCDSPNTTPLPTTTSNATAAIENEVNEKDNDTDNVPMIAGIFSGALIIIIIILVSVGTVIYRRKIRDVEWRTRV